MGGAMTAILVSPPSQRPTQCAARRVPQSAASSVCWPHCTRSSTERNGRPTLHHRQRL